VQPWLKEMNTTISKPRSPSGGAASARAIAALRGVRLNNEMMHANSTSSGLHRHHAADGALGEGGRRRREVVRQRYDITTGNRLETREAIRKLLDSGVPLAGIGVQGHLHGDSFDPAALQKSLDDLSQFSCRFASRVQLPGQKSKYYAGDRRAVMPPEGVPKQMVTLSASLGLPSSGGHGAPVAA